MIKLTTKSPTYPPRYLLHKDGRRVAIGDEVTSFRGEPAVVTGWPNSGHNRVWVKWPDMEDIGGEYFPSVFDLAWEE